MPTINISDKDIELLKAVLETMKASVRERCRPTFQRSRLTTSQISWDEVARKANMKTSKYARDRWTVVSNKIIAGEGGGKATAGGKRKDCRFPNKEPAQPVLTPSQPPRRLLDKPSRSRRPPLASKPQLPRSSRRTMMRPKRISLSEDFAASVAAQPRVADRSRDSQSGNKMARAVGYIGEHT